MTVTKDQVAAGQAVYTKRTLALYDFIVLGISNRLIWKCPTRRLLSHYNRHISANHLDVGVGTGYFLDRCQYPSPDPRIALMDLNSEALEFTAQRISRYNPAKYCQNVLEPVVVDGPKFDSIGMNYLLHCLPGTMQTKSVVFDHLKAVMEPDSILFGSTLLHRGVVRGLLAKRLMDFYNRRGIFSNQLDDLEGLKESMQQRFRTVSVEVASCAVLFSARV